MLSSLIPGLREIRAPLVAGFLWLGFFWLWIDLPPRREVEAQEGPWAALLELGDAIGRPGLLAAATFAAYLIGSLTEEVRGWIIARRTLVHWRESRLRRRGDRTNGAGVMSQRGEASITQYLYQALRDIAAEAHTKGYKDIREALGRPTDYPVADGVHLADYETLVGDTATELFHEVGLLRTRLRVSNADLAAEVDRLEAEGTLRLAMALPLTLLILTLGYQDSWLWLLGLPVVVMLVWQGQSRTQESGDALADALLAGVLTAPAVDRIRAEVQSAQDRRAQVSVRSIGGP